MDFSLKYILFITIPILVLLLYFINFTDFFGRHHNEVNLKRYKKVVNISVISLIAISINCALLLNAENLYKLAVVNYGCTRPNSPISSHVVAGNYTDYGFKGYKPFAFGDSSLSSISSNNGDELTCEQLQIENGIKVTPKSEFNQDLKEIRDLIKKMALNGEYPEGKKCFQDGDNESEQDILNRKWWVFGGSSVWLSRYQIHFMVSRVIYSNDGVKSNPVISLLYLQAFDNHWNELKNFSMILKRNSAVMKFPQILKVPMADMEKTMGPEDPRILSRTYRTPDGGTEEEPIVVFNMLNQEIDGKRGMHIFKPFDAISDEERRNSSLLLLKIKNSTPKPVEKNWVPFFDSKDQQSHLSFVYNLDPLEILKCSLADGNCIRVNKLDSGSQKAAVKTEIEEKSKIGAMRGGTNLIEIDKENLPTNVNIELVQKQYWIGFPRSHNKDCGCTTNTYRPHFLILSKDLETGVYRIEYLSNLMDFRIDVLAWDIDRTTCESRKSVLIPNSVAYWDFVKDQRTNEIQDDYMGVTFSEADNNVVLVHIKGLYSNIIKILRNNSDRGSSSSSSSSSTKSKKEEKNETRNLNKMQALATKKNSFLNGCAVANAKEYCETQFR